MEEIKENLYSDLQRLHDDISVLNNNIQILESSIKEAKTVDEMVDIFYKTNLEEGLNFIRIYENCRKMNEYGIK